MKSPATSPAFSARTNDSARNSECARSFCPRCDDVMVAPARAQHVKEDVIRHWWRCESCGHQFRTSVRLSFVAVEKARQVAVA
jgi:DNA-directed RNA polymerase subunit M/transcription elongation factor TFIIS